MPRYKHHLEYICDACGSSWDEPGDALDETISLDGTKLDGPTPCTNCDSMDVEVIVHSDEVDGWTNTQPLWNVRQIRRVDDE